MLKAAALAVASYICPGATWYYPALVTRVLDGDTLEAQVYITPRLQFTTHLRLLGVDTPELHDKDPVQKARAKEAQAYTAQKVLVKQILVHWCGEDSFGRVLAEVYVGSENLAETLVKLGLGAPYTGK